MLSTQLAGNALSKKNTVVFLTRNDRNTVRHSTTHSGARRAIQCANRVHIIISQAFHLEQLFFRFFSVCSDKMSQRRSIVPSSIDTGDPQGIRAHDTSFYWQDSAVSGTDSDDETSRTGKRADRGFEDNDKAFSDIDYPTNTGIWKRSHCSRQSSSTLDHLLQLRHEPLPTDWRWLAVSLFSSLGQLSKRDKKALHFG